MRPFHLIIIALMTFVLSSCTSLVLKPADFAWPIESVLKVEKDGKISDSRYSFSINVNELLKNEYAALPENEEVSLRVIRDVNGYYFITAKGFRFIYVFEESSGALSLKNKINIPGIDSFTNPIFNQRSPYIQFVEQEENYMLNSDGVVK
jgi:predicted transcriptional regulator